MTMSYLENFIETTGLQNYNGLVAINYLTNVDDEEIILTILWNPLDDNGDNHITKLPIITIFKNDILTDATVDCDYTNLNYTDIPDILRYYPNISLYDSPDNENFKIYKVANPQFISKINNELAENNNEIHIEDVINDIMNDFYIEGKLLKYPRTHFKIADKTNGLFKNESQYGDGFSRKDFMDIHFSIEKEEEETLKLNKNITLYDSGKHKSLTQSRKTLFTNMRNKIHIRPNNDDRKKKLIRKF